MCNYYYVRIDGEKRVCVYTWWITNPSWIRIDLFILRNVNETSVTMKRLERVERLEKRMKTWATQTPSNRLPRGCATCRIARKPVVLGNTRASLVRLVSVARCHFATQHTNSVLENMIHRLNTAKILNMVNQNNTILGSVLGILFRKISEECCILIIIMKPRMTFVIYRNIFMDISRGRCLAPRCFMLIFMICLYFELSNVSFSCTKNGYTFAVSISCTTNQIHNH